MFASIDRYPTNILRQQLDDLEDWVISAMENDTISDHQIELAKRRQAKLVAAIERLKDEMHEARYDP